MKKKRLLSLLLSFCMVAGMLLPSASAASAAAPGTTVQFSADPGAVRATDQVRVTVTGGNPKYASFADAWNELTGQYAKGGTISLIKDVTAVNGSFGSGVGFSSGGAIVLPAGKAITLDLNGHTINRGLSAYRSDGGVLEVRGELTLKGNGGAIRGGNGSTYGGVYVSGSLKMEGGSISANTAQSEGGGIYNVGQVQLSGVSVSNNIGGGIYQGGSLLVSGTTSVTGNKTSGGALCNVYLPSGRYVGATGSGLGNGARVGVTAKDQPAAGSPVTVAAGVLAAVDAQRFTSDGGYDVALESGKIVLKSKALVQQAAPAPAKISTSSKASIGNRLKNVPSATSYSLQTTATGDEGTLDETTEQTITLDPNGGKWTDTQVTTVRSHPITADSTYASLPQLTRVGYTDYKWRTADAQEFSSTAGDKITASGTLTAVWTPATYIVTFKQNHNSSDETTIVSSKESD